MTVFIALLRAVNVGGTGKLPMTQLKGLAEAAGFTAVRTYIASGNVVFRTELTAAEVKQRLETALKAYAGKPVGVLVRTAAEMGEVLRNSPYAERPGNQVMAIFVDTPPPAGALDHVTGRADEETSLGKREIYAYYPKGIGRSKLKIPAARDGTARNMNTVAKLVEMALGL